MAQQISPSVIAPSLRPIGANDYFFIAIDPKMRHLRLDILGLWTSDVAGAFAADLRRAIETLLASGMTYGTMRTMLDVRKSTIMPQDLIRTLQALAAEHGPASERVAVLCGGVLQKMQYQRIAPQDMFSCFLDEQEAKSWLFAH